VWAFLARQPLHLPVIPRGGLCPVSRLSGLPPNHLIPRPSWSDWSGTTPVFVQGLFHVHYTRSAAGVSGGWYPWKALWFASPSYHGPILIRGKQLDGPHGIRFNGKIATDPAQTDLHHDVPGQRRVWASILFFRAPGCYGVQVNGLGFSEVVVFQARP
jgi:hypothetical protein